MPGLRQRRPCSGRKFVRGKSRGSKACQEGCGPASQQQRHDRQPGSRPDRRHANADLPQVRHRGQRRRRRVPVVPCQLGHGSAQRGEEKRSQPKGAESEALLQRVFQGRHRVLEEGKEALVPIDDFVGGVLPAVCLEHLSVAVVGQTAGAVLLAVHCHDRDSDSAGSHLEPAHDDHRCHAAQKEKTRQIHV